MLRHRKRRRRLPNDVVGVFKDWQPRYLEHDIATFPVTFVRTDDGKIDKVPLIKGYIKIGTNLSSKLATRPSFADCNGIGFCPKRSYGPRLTVLDVDIADEREVDKAIARHGDTPIIVKTASGKFHLYYRHNGEPRRIRAGGNTIDLLGAGFVAAPPSVSVDGGTYEFIRGGLGDIRNLPVMRGVDALLSKPKDIVARKVAVRQETIRDGNRNGMLFRACMLQAKHSKNFDELLAFAREFNEANMQPNLLDIEVVKAATSAWGYELNGHNYIVGGKFTSCANELVDGLCLKNNDAFILLLLAQRHHADRDRFCLANAMAEKLRWTLPRFKAARRYLVENGYLVVLHQGGRGKNDPSEYGWPQRRRDR
jgi:hypothetical protein